MHPLTRAGMLKTQRPSVEHLPADALKDLLQRLRRKRLPPLFPPISGISDHRMTHSGTVNANLVGPSSLQIDLQEADTGKGLFDLPSGLCGSTPAARGRHLFSMGGVAAYRQVDDTGRCLHGSIDQCQVSFSHVTILKLAAQAMVRHVILRDNQGPGGVFIKAVDDTRPKLTPDAC